jgi:hypothetical protein
VEPGESQNESATSSEDNPKHGPKENKEDDNSEEEEVEDEEEEGAETTVVAVGSNSVNKVIYWEFRCNIDINTETNTENTNRHRSQKRLHPQKNLAELAPRCHSHLLLRIKRSHQKLSHLHLKNKRCHQKLSHLHLFVI